MKKNIFNLIMLGIYLLLLMPVFVSAQQKTGLSVDQNKIVFDMSVQEEKKFMIMVKNTGESRQTVKITTTNYTIDDDNEITFVQDDESGLSEWITYKESSFDLSPNESKDVVFTIHAPEDATIGSHRGAVLFSSENIDDEGDTVVVQGRIGVHVLVNINGQTQATGKLNSFEVPLLAMDDVEYKTVFENTGNVHYAPYGEVTIKNMFTQNITTFIYDKHFVFPNKPYSFIKKEKTPSLFGIYKVRTAFVDGEGIVREDTKIVMGYFFPLVLLAGLVIYIFVIRFVYVQRKKNIPFQKKRKNKKKRKKKKTKSANVEKKKKEKKSAKKENNKNETNKTQKKEEKKDDKDEQEEVEEKERKIEIKKE